MKKTNRQHFNSFKLNGYKLLGICMLIFLITISSCGVRKSLAHLFSQESSFVIQGTIPGKVRLFPDQTIAVWNTSCTQFEEGKSSLISGIDVQRSTAATLLLYFTLVPAFLISVLLFYKDHNHLPVPYSLQNWPQLPLFLRNRLLLI